MRRAFWLIAGLLWPLYLFDGFLAVMYYERVTTPPPVEIRITSPCFGKLPAQNPECSASPEPSPSVPYERTTPIPSALPSVPYR